MQTGRGRSTRRAPCAGRIAEYVKRFSTVKVDSTFYGTPKPSTVARWREVAPEGFLFAAKFPREFCTPGANALTLTMVTVK
jgi:uncharacterized protein YecE (DUF72 family)